MRDIRLNAKQGWVCQGIAFALLLAALFRIAMVILAGFAPRLLAVTISCDPGGCSIESMLLPRLPDALRTAEEGMPDAQALLLDHLAEPAVRFEMLIGQLIADLPVIGLLLSVAAGIYILGRTHGRALARSIPWLQRGAIFALVSVLAIPLGQSIKTTLLARGIDESTRFAFSADLGRMAVNLLLALVALAVTWALSAGMRAEQDLSEIV